MPYTPNPTWQDSPSTATPITAATLNHIEAGIQTAQAGVDALVRGLPVFNVETYGALGDGTTDDTAAINAAVAAIVTAYNAGGPGGILLFPRAVTYKVAGALLTTNGCYAQIPLPAINASATRKGILVVKGPGIACMTAANGQTGLQTGTTAVVQSTLTAQVYDATYGWPSVFGFPDVEKAGGGSNALGFSPWHLVWDGVIVRQPANPSLCALNCGTADCYDLIDFMADTTTPQASLNTEPTATTGLGFRPSHNNNNTQTRVQRAACTGYYGGIAVDEHFNAEYLLTYRTIVAHPILAPMYHGASIKHTVTEHQKYIFAGLSPSTGVVAIPGASAERPTLRALLLDIEDAPAGVFANVAHIYDPSDNLRGRISYLRIAANVGQVAGITTTNGTAQYMTQDLSSVLGFVIGSGGGGGVTTYLSDSLTGTGVLAGQVTTVGGATWTAYNNSSGAVSKTSTGTNATSSTGGVSTLNIVAADGGHSDGTINVTMALFASGGIGNTEGLIARLVDVNSYLYFHNTEAFYTTSGTAGLTSLGVYGTVVAAGQVLSVKLAGTTVTVSADGTVVKTYTLTGAAAAILGTKHGIFANGTTDLSARLTNFSFTA